MSTNDKTPDGPDDDGWGAAADDVEDTPASKVEPAGSSEWQDPVNLEKKVAALRASEQQPISVPVDNVAQESADEAKTDSSTAGDPGPAPDDAVGTGVDAAGDQGLAGLEEPSVEAGNDEARNDIAAPLSESVASDEGTGLSEGSSQGEVAALENATLKNDAEHGDQAAIADSAALNVVGDNGASAESTDSIMVSDEDAPQWAASGATDPTANEAAMPAPSSDMLAAATVIAKKTSDPKRKKRKERKEPKERSPSTGLTRKQTIRLVAGAVVLVMAGVVAILGWLNSQNFYLVCGTKSIRAEQGRFWPTGQNGLSGSAFRPIAVPSDVVCESTSYEDREELELAFLDALLAQSTRLLTSGGSEQVSVAEAQLEQALLLTRGPERAEQRELAERLKGDVSYWRGAAEVQRAAEVLQIGAKNFSDAAAKRPRHSSDASAWADHARFIAEEIDKGPRSLREDETPQEKPHFSGLSQPQEKPTSTPTTTPTSNPDVTTPEVPTVDAGVPTAPPADADVPPVDAALPRGGVLL